MILKFIVLFFVAISVKAEVVTIAAEAPTYAAAFSNITVASAATDVWCIEGSASRRIKIIRFFAYGTKGTGSTERFNIIKRSALNTGGTSSLATNVSFDSTSTSPTAKVRAYTVNPTGLGTSVGLIYSNQMAVPGRGSSNRAGHIDLDFKSNQHKPLMLRGATEAICLNFLGNTMSSNQWDFTVFWSEE